ncbi:SufD family Fe-S cluster assembly protein [Enterobacteriaceae endosymbiont of Donacia sparganii]|uniref:SufD family Fe-S cluster assembly protein n=1 Tax=Enterobacteriaceae endosymbiont of Donacia sparganii TaxID=2675785 RepID=UPI0014566105|nr:SufD family Fe-S cluster assembly protein [Enterobacteriaceae endosymbiont of Donacia sparganii]
MKNNIYNQIKNIYKLHKKYHFSNKSEINWLKLKILLKNKKYDNDKKKFLEYINNNFLINSPTLSINKNKLKNFLFEIDSVILFFINGKIDKNISNINNLYYKININTYNNIDYKNNFFKNNIFTCLSETLTKEIVSIDINHVKNINIKPLYLVYFNEGNKNNKIFMSNYRNYIYINNISSISIIEHHINTDELYFNNIYNTLILKNNSKVEYYRFFTNENNNKNCCSINNEYYLYDSIFLKKYDLFISNKHMNQSNNFQFIGKKSKLIYKSILFSKNDNLININNHIEHNGKNCCSIQSHKAISLDQSTINSIGLLKINKYAEKTNGQINYSSLLLSNLSKINIQPKLDIFNKNVKCQHSVFTGKIDSNQIFFLRSRGISFKKAYNILFIIFIKDSLREINNNNLKIKISKKISCYLSVENFFNEF